MGGIGSVRRGLAGGIVRAALACAFAACAVAVVGCGTSGDYETYATSEAAAADYATGVLTGDVEMASRAVGRALDEASLGDVRAGLFGVDGAVVGATAVVVPGPDAATSPGGRSQDANLFEVAAYETADGETVEIDADGRTPEIWVSDVEPWRVVSMDSQQAGQLFVKVLLVGLGLAIVIAVVVMIRMADRGYDDEPEAP